MCAEAGKCFEVRISPFTTNAYELTAPNHDRVLVHVYVDGVQNGGGSFARNTKVYTNTELIEKGIAKEYITNNIVMNMFTFFNVPVEEAAGANAIASMPSSENIGTITTTFTGFIKGGLRSRSAFRGIRNNVHEKPKITEKEKIKKGASIGVCGGKEVTRRSRSTTYHFPEKLKQEMPQKSIKIYIREKFWLQSRRIMDGDGLPMTAAVAKKGVGATQSKSGVNNNPMIDVDAMNAQFKIKREAIGSQKRKMRAINLDEPTGLETCKKKPKGEVIVLG